MALGDLSPWPTSTATASLTAARPCLRDALGEGLSDDRADRLGSTASALVERYAPSAPRSVRNEAVIRCAGWLAEQPAASVRSESVGDISTSYAPTHTGALRYSGAAALLSTWRVRRAGAIG